MPYPEGKKHMGCPAYIIVKPGVGYGIILEEDRRRGN